MKIIDLAPYHPSEDVLASLVRRPAALETGVLPEDFALRLELLKQSSGLTWNAFADCLGVDPKIVLRWRQGSEPSGGPMHSLFRLAACIPHGLDVLLIDELPNAQR
ncbi:MAG: hypothetical protein OXC99_00105 [Chloroflexi bacterium]|nr:hypothetical protein [Chloroflexota bacterium]